MTCENDEYNLRRATRKAAGPKAWEVVVGDGRFDEAANTLELLDATLSVAVRPGTYRDASVSINLSQDFGKTSIQQGLILRYQGPQDTNMYCGLVAWHGEGGVAYIFKSID